MRKAPFCLLWLFAALSAFLFGIPLASPPEGSAFPSSQAERQGDFIRLLEAATGEFPSESVCLPFFSVDRLGGVWAAWEEWRPEPNQIKVAKIEDNRVAFIQTLACPDGFNWTPRLAFDLFNSPWLIWANYFNGKSRIFVQNLNSGKLWAFDSPESMSVSSPALVFDRDGRAWAFWNESRPDKGVVISRVLSHGLWLKQPTLPSENDAPALSPDAIIDERGFPSVVWASYDGHDYELYKASWEGNKWGAPLRLTDNQENDFFPAFAGGSPGPPLIAWTKASQLGHQVCLAMLKNNRLEKETALCPPNSFLVVPRFYEDPAGTKITWKSGTDIQVRAAQPGRFSQKEGPFPPPPSGSFLFNPNLDENIYVCFGDSITYGYIDREPAPELGYVPRLEAILNQNFGASQAINQGIGGENTILGLARIDSVIQSIQGRFILIMEGTNDVITPNLAMSTSASNLREIVRRCLDAGVYPILATILPRYDAYGVIKYYSDRILELNRLIRQMAVDFPIAFVDMYEIFNNYPAADGGVFAVLSRDLKHPSAKGYQVMAESWFGEIKNIPFSPVHIEVWSFDGNTGFSSLREARLWGQHPKAQRPQREEAVGTYLRWQNNPKIFDPTRLQGYKIFRKDQSHPQARFRLLAFVRSPLTFFDPGLHTIDRYTYVISAVRTDGVEGPCSAEVKE